MRLRDRSMVDWSKFTPPEGVRCNERDHLGGQCQLDEEHAGRHRYFLERHWDSHGAEGADDMGGVEAEDYSVSWSDIGVDFEPDDDFEELIEMLGMPDDDGEWN